MSCNGVNCFTFFGLNPKDQVRFPGIRVYGGEVGCAPHIRLFDDLDQPSNVLLSRRNCSENFTELWRFRRKIPLGSSRYSHPYVQGTGWMVEKLAARLYGTAFDVTSLSKPSPGILYLFWRFDVAKDVRVVIDSRDGLLVMNLHRSTVCHKRKEYSLFAVLRKGQSVRISTDHLLFSGHYTVHHTIIHSEVLGNLYGISGAPIKYLQEDA